MANVQPYIPSHSGEGSNLSGGGFAGNSGEILGNQILGAGNELGADVANSNRQVISNIASVANEATNAIVNHMATVQAADRAAQALTNKSNANTALDDFKTKADDYLTKTLTGNIDCSDDRKQQITDNLKALGEDNGNFLQPKLSGYGSYNALTGYKDSINDYVANKFSSDWDRGVRDSRQTQAANNLNAVQTNASESVATGNPQDLAKAIARVHSPESLQIAAIAGKGDAASISMLDHSLTKQSMDSTYTNLANTDNFTPKGGNPVDAYPAQRQAIQGQIALLEKWYDPGNAKLGISPNPYHFGTPELAKAAIQNLNTLDNHIASEQRQAQGLSLHPFSF